MKIVWRDRTADVHVGKGKASIDGRRLESRAVIRDDSGAVEGVELAGEVVPVRARRDGERVFVWCRGRAFEFRRAADRPRGQGRGDGGGLVSPMPGRVRKVLVAAGDAVKKGDVLLILEAMKMEHSIRSPRDGRVTKVAFAEGDLVDAGVELVEIGEAPAESLP